MNPFDEMHATCIPKSVVQKLAGLCIATSTRAGLRTMCRHLDNTLGGRHGSFQQLESELPTDMKHFEDCARILRETWRDWLRESGEDFELIAEMRPANCKL